jgi:hypothetical protein
MIISETLGVGGGGRKGRREGGNPGCFIYVLIYFLHCKKVREECDSEPCQLVSKVQ